MSLGNCFRPDKEEEEEQEAGEAAAAVEKRASEKEPYRLLISTSIKSQGQCKQLK